MDWPIVPISNLCKTGSGGTPSRSKIDKYYGGHIPWIKSGELYSDIITSAEEFITDDAVAESSAKLIPSGAILVAMYGATVGQTSMGVSHFRENMIGGRIEELARRHLIMTPKDQERLEACSAEIAEILYRNSAPEGLESLAGIEQTVR